MSTAFVHLPDKVTYRRDAFVNGLARHGFIVVQGEPDRGLNADDVVVVWNRLGRSRRAIEAAKMGGAALIVAENGYVGRDAEDRQPYAMALDGHNGSGRWFADDADTRRLDALNIDFQPFRPIQGRRVLVAAQRGIGSARMASPHDFVQIVVEDLEGDFNEWRCRVRPHPGQGRPLVTLENDLKTADALVVWSSNCATEALIRGVPTFYKAPAIVTAHTCQPYSRFLEGPFCEARRAFAFNRLAWAQWFVDEIGSGEAFDKLLQVHRGTARPCQRGIGE